MDRLARVIAPGVPHHATQRENPRQETFFGHEDFQHYLELIAQFCRAEQVAIWAYCLMPNHVHLIVVPRAAESLRRAIGEAHRRYTRWTNFREGWRGHPRHGRFASFVRDEDHHLTTARYVELKPVSAGLGKCRRLTVDREKSVLSSESFVKLAMIQLMLNRLRPSDAKPEFHYRTAA